ncbi:hypothetical protein DMENIID0001_022960 [Sergentomyia squamirostris]
MEAYKILNLELALKVRDLKNELRDNRDLIKNLKKENLNLWSEIVSLKELHNKTLQSVSQIAPILQEVLQSHVGRLEENNVRHEISKLRYSANSSLRTPTLKSSPEKPDFREVHVTLRRFNKRHRKTALTPTCTGQPDDTNIENMSIDETLNWLRENDDVVPLLNEDQPQVPQEMLTDEAKGQRNHLTVIAEESCSNNDSSLTIQQSLLHVTNFASSTPLNSGPCSKASSCVVMSPIVYVDPEGLNNPSKKTSDSVSSLSGSSTTASSSNVTVRRGKEKSRDKENTQNSSTHSAPPTPATFLEKKQIAEKTIKRPTLQEKTNHINVSLEKNFPAPPPIKVEDWSDVPQRPRRNAAPTNLQEPNLNSKLRRT